METWQIELLAQVLTVIFGCVLAVVTVRALRRPVTIKPEPPESAPPPSHDAEASRLDVTDQKPVAEPTPTPATQPAISSGSVNTIAELHRIAPLPATPLPSPPAEEPDEPDPVVDSCDVFVSYSRDMATRATRAEGEIKLFDRALSVFNYRDIDPATLNAGTIWQDRIVAPSRSNAGLVLVLLGERIGLPLPPDFGRRRAISRRLRTHKLDWIHVPGVDPPIAEGQVPLTGVLYELLDVWLAMREGRQIQLMIAMSGRERGPSGPVFDAGAWSERLANAALNPDNTVRAQQYEDHAQQLRWLQTFYDRFLSVSGKALCVWASSDAQFAGHVRTRVRTWRRGSATYPTDLPLPGIEAFDQSHALIYRPGTEVLTQVLRDIEAKPRTRNFVILEGASGVGKSSLLRAGIAADYSAPHMRDRGARLALIDIAHLGNDGNPIKALGSRLLEIDAVTGDGGLHAFAANLAQHGDRATAHNLLETLQYDALSGPVRTSVDQTLHLILAIDQLEDAVARAESDWPDHAIYQEFLRFVCSLGHAEVTTEAKPARFIITIVATVDSHRLDAFTNYAGSLAVHRLRILGLLDWTTTRAMFRDTLDHLQIKVDPTGIDALINAAEETFPTGRPLLPFVSVALKNLQLFWSSLPQPRRALSRDEILAHGSIVNAIDQLGEAAWRSIGTMESELTGQVYALPMRGETIGVRRQSLSPTEVAFNRLMRRLVDGKPNDNSIDLATVPMAVLAAPERTIADPLIDGRLLQRLRRNDIRVTHREVVYSWKKASRWLHDQQSGLSEEALLKAAWARLQTAKASGSSTGPSYYLTDPEFERGFKLYSHWGDDLHQDARQFLNECLAFRSHTTPEFAQEALIFAASTGNPALTQEIVAANKEAVHKPQGESMATALHFATQNGHKEAAEILIANQAVIDVETKEKFTPLHLAAQNGHADIVQLLLNHEANVDARTNDGGTPLHLASGFGHDKIVGKLASREGINLNVRTNNQSTPLHLSAQHGHASIVHTLLEHHADSTALTSTEDTPLHLATINGHYAAVEVFCSYRDRVDLNAPTHNGVTPLVLAIDSGYFDIARLLATSGASVVSGGRSGRMPLHAAIASGDADLVKTLVDLLPDGDRTRELHHAANSAFDAHKPELLSILLQAGAQFGDQNLHKDPLLIAATRVDDLLMMRVALNHYEVNAVDTQRKSALHHASELGYARATALLIEHGADCNLPDSRGWLPLHFAAARDHLPVIDLLLRGTSDINAVTEDPKTPFDLAIAAHHELVADYLAQRGGTTADDGEDGHGDDFEYEKPVTWTSETEVATYRRAEGRVTVTLSTPRRSFHVTIPIEPRFRNVPTVDYFELAGDPSSIPEHSKKMTTGTTYDLNIHMRSRRDGTLLPVGDYDFDYVISC